MATPATDTTPYDDDVLLLWLLIIFQLQLLIIFTLRLMVILSLLFPYCIHDDDFIVLVSCLRQRYLVLRHLLVWTLVL